MALNSGIAVCNAEPVNTLETISYSRADGSLLANIPIDLQVLPQWVAWKVIPDPGKPKPKKVPFDVKSGLPASSTDSATWGSFENACKGFANNQCYAGIGFVVSESDPYCGIDLDHCRNAITGEIEDWAQIIIEQLRSYTEVSPSGTGLRIFAQAHLPPGRRKKGRIEMYDSARYLTVTGQHIGGTPLTIEQRQVEIEAIHQAVFGQAEVSSATRQTVATPAEPHVSDSELMKRIQSSPHVKKFDMLFGGDWEGEYPSQSEADLALCSILAFWTGGNAQQIDRLFRESLLMRPKWDEFRGAKTYGAKTIDEALSGHAQTISAEQNLLEQFNKRFAVISVGSKVYVLEETSDPLSNRVGIKLLSRQDFSMLTANVPFSERHGSASASWLKHPQRRELKGIVFAPGKTVDGYFNLFRGFPVDPISGGCETFWKFVHEVICSGSNELYRYIRKWMAHLIQRPSELPEVALVLRGAQGTGKNTFVDALGYLVGPHYVMVTSMDQVTGRFNAHLQNALLVNANEAIWGGNKAAEGALKSMITDPLQTIEQKGKDIFSVSNYKRLIVSSNEDWAVPRGIDDRRFVVIDVAPSRKEDHAYFSAVREELNNGGYQALMYDLLHEPLDGFYPRVRPHTGYGLDLKMSSANSVEKFWYECLDAGVVESQYNTLCGLWEGTNYAAATVPKGGLSEAYRKWCADNREHHPEPESQFFKKLRKMVGEMRESRPSSGINRARMLHLPSLKDCRTAFERYLHESGGIDWTPVEDD